MTTACSFRSRLEHWNTVATIPVYFAAWFYACYGEGPVLMAHGAICALGYTIGYVIELRRGHFALSVDGTALGLAALACAASLGLFHLLGLWPLSVREGTLFVAKGMLAGWFLGHVAGAALFIGLGTLLDRVFKQRIEAEQAQQQALKEPQSPG